MYETAYITLAVYAYNTFVPSLFISVYPLQYMNVIVSSCVICFMVKSLFYLVSFSLNNTSYSFNVIFRWLLTTNVNNVCIVLLAQTSLSYAVYMYVVYIWKWSSADAIGASVVRHHSLLLMISFNKTEDAVFSCRLCFLMAFPFISLILLTTAGV